MRFVTRCLLPAALPLLLSGLLLFRSTGVLAAMPPTMDEASSCQLPEALVDVGEPRSVLRDRLAVLEQQFEVRLAEDGAFSTSLIEPSAAIGALLQALGRHREALRYYSRAMHLQRVNEGLQTATQEALLDRVLRSQLSLGDFKAADDTQEQLFRLRRQHAESEEERLEAVRSYARWKCVRFLRDRGPGSFRDLVDIYIAHEQEMRRLRDSGPASIDELPHLYERVQLEYLISNYEGERWTGARASVGGAGFIGYQNGGDLHAERFRLLRKHNYRNGRETLERAVEIIRAQPDLDEEALARAHIALGDWHMWWNEVAPALASYRAAWRVYSTDGSDATDPESLFVAPLVLPEASPFYYADASDPRVDRVSALVRFNVSRRGEAQRIEFLEVEARDGKSARAAVYRMLRASRFRPVVRNGEPVEFTGLVRRYAYNYH